ncbi:hypothetical protein LS482_16040 [Sinomicrobium kalidii]|uniref:hypothetical protein n=1 Tax=Sinomicrobium kalidii TaxID=2900738 RepID=UPI001E3952E8|nr:hypothetical protein [Sinomicrobium kalidii]UGU15183.1 hypothetical protein LS482_16040 [Sinomicrobium kalidii]
MAKRAVSVEALLRRKFAEMPFTGPWKDAFGIPARSGVWLIWGASGNGKTSFCLQLGKYLTKFGKVAYNTLEEGLSKSMQDAISRANMQQVKSRFILLDREPMGELEARIKRRRSPDIIIIDSLQYSGLTRNEYKRIKERFSNKLFIFISHAEGKQPEGRTAKFVRYDADVKVRVEGYKAFPTSRFGGGEPYVIWHEGAHNYWMDI